MLSIHIIILLLSPLMASIIVLFSKSNTNYLRNYALISVSSLSGINTIFLVKNYIYQHLLVINYHILSLAPGITISLQIEHIGIVFISLVSFLWPLTLIYTSSYLEVTRDKKKNTFLFFINLSIFATYGIALSGNLVTTFIFYEMLTLVTYPLVTHYNTENSKIAGRWYLGLLMGNSIIFFLTAIIIIHMASGNTQYVLGGIHLNLSNHQIIGIIVLILFGVNKLALMPFHKWLPEAMVAPVPASALLHAVAVVKSGAFIIIKFVIYIIGIDKLNDIVYNHGTFNWLLIIPSVTMLAASYINLFETKLKKILAYSTIGQLAYISFCVLLLNKSAITGSILYLISHSLTKIVLFFVTGMILTSVGKDTVRGSSGTIKILPLAIICFVISSFALLGLPFTSFFVTKSYMLKGIITSHSYGYIWVVIVSSVLISIYIVRMVYSMVFGTINYDYQKLLEYREQSKQRPHLVIMTSVVVVIVIANISLYFLTNQIVNFLNPIFGTHD